MILILCMIHKLKLIAQEGNIIRQSSGVPVVGLLHFYILLAQVFERC